MLRKPHYAWLICLGGCLTLMITMGLGANVYTIYQPQVIAQNGFTNAQGSWITTTRSLFILATLLTVNQLCAKLGLRLVMTLGMALVGGGCFLFGSAGNFPMYCVAAAVTGIGYCLGGMVPLSLIIGNWFHARRSLALGIASAGSGLTTIFMPPILTWLIGDFSLRTAFFCEGAFILAVTALVWCILRSRPEEMGLLPYGEEASVSAVQNVPQDKSHSVWPIAVVLLAAFLLGGPVGPGYSHLTVLFRSEGYDSMVVANLISYSGLVLFVSKVVFGQLYDRLGSLVTNFILFGVMFSGLCLLCILAPTGSTAAAYAAITVFTGGIAITAVSPSVWARDLTTADNYDRLVRAITVIYTFGMLVFGPLPGMLADHFDSYIPAYALFAGLFLLTASMIQITYLKLGVGRREKAARS